MAAERARAADRPATLRLLLVEDSDADAQLLAETLADAKTASVELVRVARMTEAVDLVAAQDFDAIVLDLSLPDSNPAATLARVRECAAFAPVVVATGSDDEHLAGEAIRKGAHAYLVKGEGAASFVVRTLRQATARFQLARDLEIARRRELSLSTRDPLTGLANRPVFRDQLIHAVERARRGAADFALLVVDLDRFHLVNDTRGHEVGDHLLQQAAASLRERVRSADRVARIGADEFGVFLHALDREHDAARVAEDLLAGLAHPVMVEGAPLSTTASVGIALHPRDGSDAETLLQSANLALAQAKQRGGGSYEFHTPGLKTAAQGRLRLENDLRDALEREEFVVHYHAVVDATRSAVVGAEALVRWQHPTLGLLLPERFLALAEETRLIVPIGTRVLREACRQAQQWRTAGYAPFRISVNLSAVQLRELDFLAGVQDVLRETGLPPDALQLELTESVLFERTEEACAVMARLRELGVHLALDDFGTGYASLAYLKRFPLTALKIDRSFVLGTPHDAADVTLTRAAIAVALGLGLDVIAEGVETRPQLEFLVRHGCTKIQGFLFGRPEPAEALERMLASARTSGAGVRRGRRRLA